ncbi:NAD(P)/FAD-dependent oxidoreductase [Corynebacterium glutamicum]|uniref:NAD(P)/FAD-dependent oxidoreductase n=1 Tax=Corynebacterium glutamicum TaxID=1718 RepID=UPI0007449E27|nr:FAD-dependent oxidoreductase [Corynebacterium glutamicum]ALZ98807.1 hypothetical protein APT58_00300 [Corynebacterium glutamicum]
MSTQSTYPIIIIGAGHAGVTAAARLLEQNWRGGIVLIDEQPDTPYERPPLSKELLKASSNGQAQPLRKSSWFEGKGIRLISGLLVERITPESTQIQLSDGQKLTYHRLIIATGATARTLQIPGADLPGVQMLKTQRDANQLRESLQPGKKIIVIGAGYIGMEVAAAAAAAGSDTTVIEFQDRIMSRVTSQPVSEYFEKLHEAAGTKFIFNTGAIAFEGKDHIERVVTNTGQTFEADAVIVGIGVIPNQQLAEEAGIKCRDGILVDGSGRTSKPLIYAIGDVTRSICPFEKTERRLECIQNATFQAAQVALSIMEKEATEPEIPWFWTVQHGKRLQTAGVRSPEDDVILRGEPASGKFSVLYIRDGRLSAIDTIGRLTDFKKGKKLIMSKAPLDLQTASNPELDLLESVLTSASV